MIPVQRYGWLFASQLPDLGTGFRFSDPAYDAALREQRAAAVAEVEKLGLDAVREFAAHAVDARIVGACLADATVDKYRAEVLAMVHGGDWLMSDWPRAGLPAGSSRTAGPGWTSFSLENSRPSRRPWRCSCHGITRRRGRSLTPAGRRSREAFWRYFSINGLGHGFSHATEAAGRLAQAGRVAAALKLVVIYLDDLGGQAADFLIGLLSQFAGTYQSDPEIGLVTEYDFRSVFDYLNQHADLERNAQVGQLEWAFVAVLGDEPPVARLYEALTTDPDLFVTVMEIDVAGI